MSFNPGLFIGEIITNDQLVHLFNVRNSSGMRYNRKENLMVLVADYTKGIFLNKWIGNALHLTGTGQKGDQRIDKSYNKTLSESNANNTELHLFQVYKPNQYTYCGQVKLTGTPYTQRQPDTKGVDRAVWVFPLTPVHNEYIEKPIFFADEEDCRLRGKEEERKYIFKRDGLKGARAFHVNNGNGIIKSLKDDIIEILFDNGALKTFNYTLSLTKKTLQILY